MSRSEGRRAIWTTGLESAAEDPSEKERLALNKEIRKAEGLVRLKEEELKQARLEMFQLKYMRLVRFPQE